MKEAGGRRTYHWARVARGSQGARPDEAGKEEPANLDDMPERPPIRLTTFADWKEVGEWFAGLERAARKVTPGDSGEGPDSSRPGRASDVEKLEALYDFVSKNFRYVSLSLGAGRYQPRAAADVLRDAYGDCKDKHTLLASVDRRRRPAGLGRAHQLAREDRSGLSLAVAVRSRDYARPSPAGRTCGSTRRRKWRRFGCCRHGPAEEAGARRAGGAARRGSRKRRPTRRWRRCWRRTSTARSTRRAR